MENSTKALLIAGAVLISIVVMAMGVVLLKSGENSGEQVQKIGNEISSSTQETIDKIQTGLDSINTNKEIKVKSIVLNATELYEEFYGSYVYKELKATVFPENATNKKVEWSSSDENVATVDDTGRIVIKSYGFTIITAKATDGSETFATCNLTAWQAVCFVEGTQVLTEDGYVNIEDIKAGDYVYTLNLDNNQRELKQVEKAIISKSKKIYKLTIGGEFVEATPRHQFYIVDKGWVRAYDLEIGDTLVSKEDKLVVSNIEEIIYEEPITVYNLEVEGNHNYLVTKYEVLVHNAASPV